MPYLEQMEILRVRTNYSITIPERTYNLCVLLETTLSVSLYKGIKYIISVSEGSKRFSNF